MTQERQIMTEFLQLYKELTCLWNNKQTQYNNRAAREKAYEILLEKYRELHEEASILDVKNRIEFMRTTYKREHKKVIRSRLNGDIEEYTPVLWYYELLSFLNDVSVPNRQESTPRSSGAEVSINLDRSETKPKKNKLELSTVYMPEQDDHFSDDEVYVHQDEESMISTANQMAEAEAFGTTVGLQLKDLDPMQRVFAEKLISDAIFQARLHNLNANSVIVTNNDRNVEATSSF